MQPDTDALRLTAGQAGAISRRQLRDAGLTDRQVHERVRAGLLVPLHRGIYRTASAPPTFEQKAWAAQLAYSPVGVLSHRTAGALWGLRGMARDVIDVTLSGPRTAIEGVQRHRSQAIRRADIQERRDGLLVTRPFRTLVDLAWVLDEDAFEQAFEDALHRGLVSLDAAQAYWARTRARGRRGGGAFGRFLAARPAGERAAESGLEVALLQALRRHGLDEPVRQHWIELPGGARFRADLAYVDARIDIEVDHSWWHGGEQRRRDDLRRDAALVAHGWAVMRFDEDRLEHRLDACVGEVAQALEARASGTAR